MADGIEKKLKKLYEKSKPTRVSNREDKKSIYYDVSGDEKVLTKEIEKCIVEIKKLGSNPSPAFQSLGLGDFELNYSVVNNSKTELKPLLKALKHFCQIAEKYGSIANNPQSNTFLKDLFDSYKKKLECYRDTFKAYNQGLTKLETFKTFDEKAFNAQVSKNEKMFSTDYQRDLEVVRALEFVGYECGKNSDGTWYAKENKDSTNGIYYNDEKGQSCNVLSQDDVNSFLKNYLNLPFDKRDGHIITADGIFKLYMEEAKEKCNIHKTVFGNVKINGVKSSLNNETLSAYEKRYATSGADWQSFLAESSNFISNDAVKMAYAELYAENLNGDTSLLADNALQQLSDEIEENFQDQEKKAKYLRDIITHADNLNINMDNSPEFDLLHIRKTYNDRVKSLVAQSEVANLGDEKQAELEEKILTAKQSCYKLDSIKTFAKKAVRELDRDSYDSMDNYKKDMSSILNLISEPDFITFDESIGITYDKNKVPDEFKAQFEQAFEKMNGFSRTHSFSRDEELEIEELNNLIMEYANVPGMDDSPLGNAMKEELLYETTEGLVKTGNDNELTLLIDKYRQAYTNNPMDPNCVNFSTFVSAISTSESNFANNEGEPLFTLDALTNVEQLTRESAEKKYSVDPKQVQNAKDKREEIRNNADRAYEMFARIKRNLQNKFPDLSRNEITPGEIQKAYSDIAKQMQYEKDNGLKYQPTPEELQDIEGMKDQQSGAYAKNIDEYIKSGKADGFGDKLKNDVVNLVDPILKKEDAKSKDDVSKAETKQKIKFSKKYPRDKTAELLKKFKPYCAKSTGKIIEKLLKMIESCDIYITKKSPASFKVDDLPSKAPAEPAEEVKAEISTADISEVVADGAVDDAEKASGSSELKEEKAETVSHDENISIDDTKSSNPSATNVGDTSSMPKDGEKGMPVYGDGANKYLSKPEFSSYKILSLGLEKILTDKNFEKNANWLDEKEKGCLKDLKTIMDFIISKSKTKDGTPEYEDENNLKKQLSTELLRKSTTSDMAYRRSNFDNMYLMPTEVFESMVNIANNCDLEMIASIMSITTDLTKPTLGNNLDADLVEKISTSGSKEEVWQHIRECSSLINNIWNTPANISSELQKTLVEIHNQEKGQEEPTVEDSELNSETAPQEEKEEVTEETKKPMEYEDDYSADFVEEELSEEELLEKIKSTKANNGEVPQLNNENNELEM